MSTKYHVQKGILYRGSTRREVRTFTSTSGKEPRIDPERVNPKPTLVEDLTFYAKLNESLVIEEVKIEGCNIKFVLDSTAQPPVWGPRFTRLMGNVAKDYFD